MSCLLLVLANYASCRAVPCLPQGCGYYRDDKNTSVPVIAWNETVKVRHLGASGTCSRWRGLVFGRMLLREGGGGVDAV